MKRSFDSNSTVQLDLGRLLDFVLKAPLLPSILLTRLTGWARSRYFYFWARPQPTKLGKQETRHPSPFRALASGATGPVISRPTGV